MADLYFGKKLLDDIKARNESVTDKFVMQVFKSGLRNEVINYLRNANASEQQAEDAFSEGFTYFLKRAQDGEIDVIDSLAAYLKVVCKRRWLTALKKSESRKNREQTVFGAAQNQEPRAYGNILKEERQEFLDKFLSLVGEDCKNLFLLRAEGYSSKEISERTKYGSAGAVDKKLSGCRKKIAQIIAENPNLKDEFDEFFKLNDY